MFWYFLWIKTLFLFTFTGISSTISFRIYSVKWNVRIWCQSSNQEDKHLEINDIYLLKDFISPKKDGTKITKMENAFVQSFMMSLTSKEKAGKSDWYLEIIQYEIYLEGCYEGKYIKYTGKKITDPTCMM